MLAIATFDIGTTAVKAVLVDETGTVLASASQDIPTLFQNGRKEQDPNVWWEAFRDLSQVLFTHCDTRDIAGIVMSGQMQDVIPVDESLAPLGNAILYADGRGAEEAKKLNALLGPEKIAAITGNAMDGTLSLPKILWLREHEPDIFTQAKCFLISSKDYVNARLTGICASDVTACSTAGAMNLQECAWSGEILQACGLNEAKLPKLYASHQAIGTVTADAASQTGYKEGTPVYAGVGDAGATTLASGIVNPGEYNINLGTSGWIATISDNALRPGEGVFNLAAMPTGKVINVIPFLNAGNVHHWVSALFSPATDKIDYEGMNELLSGSEAGSHGVMALPYLAGERFPVPDPYVKGAYLGITLETGRADMARAMLEGVAYSIRQGLEGIGTPVKSISVIGGGGRVPAWCAMLSNILGQTVRVYKNANTLPARAIAAATLIGQKRLEGYEAFIQKINVQDCSIRYEPEALLVKRYDALYQHYKGLYPLVKDWFSASCQ